MPETHDEAASIAAILEWDRQLDELDYYALLGVLGRPDSLVVEQAFHGFARRFHPDCHPDYPSLVRQALTRIFQRGVEARRVLSDPQLQARYRELLRHGVVRLTDEAPSISINLELELPRLHESCRSAGAKLEAQAAARAWRERNIDRVRQRLISALGFDGNANRDIERVLDAIDAILSD